MKSLLVSALCYFICAIIWTIRDEPRAAGLCFLVFVYLAFRALRHVRKQHPEAYHGPLPPEHPRCRCVIAPHIEWDRADA